jgi:hypothetical protein
LVPVIALLVRESERDRERLAQDCGGLRAESLKWRDNFHAADKGWAVEKLGRGFGAFQSFLFALGGIVLGAGLGPLTQQAEMPRGAWVLIILGVVIMASGFAVSGVRAWLSRRAVASAPKEN